MSLIWWCDNISVSIILLFSIMMKPFLLFLAWLEQCYLGWKYEMLRACLEFYFFQHCAFIFVLFYLSKFILKLFWLRRLCIVVHGLSLVVVSGVYCSWRAQASHCGGLSCCRAQAPGLMGSVAASLGLQSSDSAAVPHRLSCCVACGIFPDQGSNPCPCIARQIVSHCIIREALF